MVRRSFRLLAALSLCAVAPVSATAEEGSKSTLPFSHVDVDDAWEAAQQRQLPLLVFATMDNCHFCHKMIEETYANPQVAYGLRRSTISTTISREEHPDLIGKLGVRAYPTTFLISPEGELLARIEGFADAKKFIETMRPALIASAQRRQTAQNRAGADEVGAR